jgi:glycosyltransferase involved in cell wall biosynthesis
MLKVSVVIPTYNSPVDGLSGLVRSLDAQTMPADEFEVIFIDDGSPDDTVERLQQIASTRPNIRIERIENSGWPSKPRNIGIELAVGEYIAFMDHDDQLYPDALRAGHEFATANDADVLNGKEAYTNTAHWGLGTYISDQAQSIGRKDVHPLIPMNPHKLYRRDFLLDHGIRFIEGRKVLWEDQFFNIEAARYAKVISTMSSVPYYHWVETKGSGSTLFVKEADDYWMWLRRLLEETVGQLADDEHELQRRQLVKNQYSARVLGVFDGRFMKRSPKARRFLFDKCKAIQTDFGMTRFDDEFSSSRRMRAFALRTGDLDLMEKICTQDTQIDGWGRATGLRWKDGVLQIDADIVWESKDGRTLDIERVEDRLYKRVSDDVAAVLPVDTRDVTKELPNARVELSVRSRASRIVWLTPTDTDVTVGAGEDGEPRLSGVVHGTIDPRTAAFGNELNSTHWDIFQRVRLGHWINHRAMLSAVPASVTVTDGRLHIVYPNDGGAATMIPDGAVEAVRRLAPLGARVASEGRIEIPLAGSHDGGGTVDTKLGLAVDDADAAFQTVPATLTVADGSAVLAFDRPDATVRVRVGDRAPGAPMWRTLVLEEDAVRWEDGPMPKPKPAPVEAAKPRPTIVKAARRRVGRVLRRMGLR